MRKFDLLNSTNDDTPVKVVRDGEVMEIPKQDVVVGDVVILQSGEEVPADGRLHEAVSLKVNESTLTGEPMIDKTTDRPISTTMRPIRRTRCCGGRR